jgi:lipopolysaccharide export system protein LptA
MMRRRIRAFYPLCLMLLFSFSASAQSTPAAAPTGVPQDSGKLIRIIRADRLTLMKVDSATERYILSGNVLLQQDKTLFYCDSAIKDESQNSIEAFGNIHINDADSVHTYAQYLKYQGNAKLATLREKVKLTDGKGVLTTDELEYDLNARIGAYTRGGKVVNGSSVLTSRQGFYYADTRQVYFQDKVKLVDPEYTMSTDTLLYDINRELATFVALTTINDGRSRIKTRSGYYNLNTGEAEFGKRPMVEDSAQLIIADSLKYDKKSGFGFAKGNVLIRDTAQGLTVLSGQAEVNQENGRLLATLKPVMILKRDKDSLFIAADTLLSGKRMRTLQNDSSNQPVDSSAQVSVKVVSDTGQVKNIRPANSDSAKVVPDTRKIQHIVQATSDSSISKEKFNSLNSITKSVSDTALKTTVAVEKKTATSDSIRYFLAYRHVRIFSDSLQGVCDSLAYSSEDSIFRFFQTPILWARDSQITGDTILMLTQNQQPYQMTVLENGFSVSRTPENLFNQIRGNNLYAFFTDGDISKIRAQGSAESLYYLQAEDSSYFGLNYAQADAINLSFINRELKRVTWVAGVEGVTYPFNQIPADKKKLRGFQWLEERRPKSRYELFMD